MNTPQDYLQPEFFRFGWDQFFFVDNVAQLARQREYDSIVELGAGSGILTCELSQKLKIQQAHLVEVQETEWKPFLTENVERFSRLENANYHWSKVSEFNLDGGIQSSLVICNPPYFVPKDGRPSPDERRNIAHRFVVDEWQAWVDAMVRTLAPGGEAWWLHRDPGPRGKPVFPENFEWSHPVRSGRMRIIRLTRLNVE